MMNDEFEIYGIHIPLRGFSMNIQNDKTPNTISAIKNEAVNKIGKLDINAQDTLRQVMKIPMVKINRETFLRKELMRFYSTDVVNLAIENNPAYAGINQDTINKIATQVINYETNKVSAVSFAAGIPGGFAMAATIPADVAQYFTFLVRVMQKLSYLYGFKEFDFNENSISDETMNDMLIFLGIMFGVQEANIGVKVIAEAAAKKIATSLPQKALTKGVVYPIIKKIASQVGIKMTKQIFAESVAKIVPLMGGAVAGGLTYATFKPCCNRLKNNFSKLELCNPDFYKNNTSII